MLRTGFFRGALRRMSAVPPLILHVRGWPNLLADAMGLRREPYFVRSRNGVRCELRPGRSDWWIFLEIFVFGIYRKVEDDIRRSDVIVDIGANVGFFALYAASLNSRAKIHAFEPFPKNVAQMNNNLRLNEAIAREIRLHPEAVADRAGTATLYFAAGDDSGCSLSQGGNQSQSCAVPVVHVKDLFGACGIDRCDLLKMDCEGSELPILRATPPEMLAKIGAIIMEYHDPAEVEPLTRLLSGAGFRCEVLAEIKTLYAGRR